MTTECQCGGSCTCETNWKTGFNHQDSTARMNTEITISTVHSNGFIPFHELERRRKRALEEYGPDFVGDPVSQAVEEAGDLEFYLACAWQESGDYRWLRLLQQQARITEQLAEYAESDRDSVVEANRHEEHNITEVRSTSHRVTINETACDCVGCTLLRKLNVAWESFNQ